MQLTARDKFKRLAACRDITKAKELFKTTDLDKLLFDYDATCIQVMNDLYNEYSYNIIQPYLESSHTIRKRRNGYAYVTDVQSLMEELDQKRGYVKLSEVGMPALKGPKYYTLSIPYMHDETLGTELEAILNRIIAAYKHELEGMRNILLRGIYLERTNVKPFKLGDIVSYTGGNASDPSLYKIIKFRDPKDVHNDSALDWVLDQNGVETGINLYFADLASEEQSVYFKSCGNGIKASKQGIDEAFGLFADL